MLNRKCHDQKFTVKGNTVIVSLLWSQVRCLLRTDHNKKVMPPLNHAQIAKETVFRKIHFILVFAETIIKRFSKGSKVCAKRKILCKCYLPNV